MILFTEVGNGQREAKGVYGCVCMCAHCVCVGEAVEQGGIEDVVHVCLTSKRLCFG